MQNLKKTILVFFLHGILCSTSTRCMEINPERSNNVCLTQACSFNAPITRYVEFPFIIKNESLPNSCGYPGFDLLCNGDDNKLLINLPNYSGVFTVEEIDYVNQVLWLNDPDKCLPRRLLSLNDSNFKGTSPFFPVFDSQVFWFYNCSNDFFNSIDYNMSRIMCLSGPTYGVFATSSEKIIDVNSTLCNEIGAIRVPVRKMSKEMYSSWELRDDIMMTWDKPRECGKCYRRGGKCRFKTSYGLEVGCFNIPRQGLSRAALFAIALAFAAPFVLVTFCITLFMIKAIQYRRSPNNVRLSSVALTSVVTPQPETVIYGLDQSIIESYPKIVLGESRRLPKPDDNGCPICLGEYLAKEILKIIPDCNHCFHADCIDEWLTLNASCPICRSSPSITPDNNVL